MTKITKIEDKTYQGKVTGHIITLADGTNGYLTDKVSDNVKVDDDVFCTTEVRKNSKGGEYNLLTLRLAQQTAVQSTPQSAQPVTTPASIPDSTRPSDWGAKTIPQMKFEARLDVIELVTRLLLGGKIEIKEAKEYYNEWVVMVDTTIDEIKV